MSRVISEYSSSDIYRAPPDFSHQFTNFYSTRLARLKPEINIPLAWQRSAKQASRSLDIEQNQLCYLSGTITREASAKPNIMMDLKMMYHGQTPEHSVKYSTPQDKYFIEDEYGRIEIVRNVPSNDFLVTGMVVAVLGSQNQLGQFEVGEIVYPKPAPQQKRRPEDTKQHKKVALVSGLLLDEEYSEPLGVQLLMEYLAEESEISSLIIAGNSLRALPSHLSGARMMRPVTKLSSLEELDQLLSALGMILPVHLMPGETDPVTIAFPQTAFHPAILQKSRSLLESHALSLETNPQRFEVNGTVIFGTSGQPINDLKRYTTEGDEQRLKEESLMPNSEASADIVEQSLDLKLLNRTLLWRHVAPTAPDTISSYPYTESDPLVLTERPHVYFSANTSEFSTALVNGVRLICVPEFRRTYELVLLNLDDLSVELVSFKKH